MVYLKEVIFFMGNYLRKRELITHPRVDESGNPSEVITRLVPENNSLVFFEVSAISFHQVSEVLADKTRLSLGRIQYGILSIDNLVKQYYTYFQIFS